jgi:hypothetical protein
MRVALELTFNHHLGLHAAGVGWTSIVGAGPLLATPRAADAIQATGEWTSRSFVEALPLRNAKLAD